MRGYRGQRGGEVVAAENHPVPSSAVAARPAMRTLPAGFVDRPQLHPGDRACVSGTVFWDVVILKIFWAGQVYLCL